MRYLPGQIAVSQDADLPLMRMVHCAGHLTTEQLYTAIHAVRVKRLCDSLRWRVKRLVDHEFLDRTQVAGMKGSILSLGDYGELYLQSHADFLVERGSRIRGARKRHQIWHDVDLFGIRLALRDAGVIGGWESEPEVKATNDFTTNHYAKDYDAVVTFFADGKRGRVALEYERTPKWSKEYERIVKDLDRDWKVDSFLYLVPNVEMHVFVRHALRATRRPMFVAFAKEFALRPRTAELIDVRTQRPACLDACLAESNY